MAPSFSSSDAWLPSIILETAKEIIRAGSTDPEFIIKNEQLLIRLTVDVRMAAVWRVLFQADVRGHYLYPANTKRFDPAPIEAEHLNRQAKVLRAMGDAESLKRAIRFEAEAHQCIRSGKKAIDDVISPLSKYERQEWASSLFFRFAFITAALNKVVTADEIDQAAGSARASATNLESSAAVARSLLRDGHSVQVDDAANRLRDEAIAILSQKDDVLVVKRHRADDQLRAFAIKMEEYARSLFKTSLYGTVAAVANVAFDQRCITGGQIRDLVRQRSR